jgi:metal-responsive CopG/Arc/MetJ family transcriptional regulator
MTRISMSIPLNLLEKVDSIRGDIPRSLFVRRILEKALKKSKENQA